MDKRWEHVADILVNHSCKVQPNEKVMVAMCETHTEDLCTALVEKIIQAGGFPQVQFLSEKFRHRLLKYGNQAQLTRIPDLEDWGMEWGDVYIGLRGGFNLSETFDISSERLSQNQVVNGKISRARWQKTRWCLIRVPSIEMAVEAGISFEELQNNFFDSCFLDWKAKKIEWDQLGSILEKGKTMRIVAPQTDLTFSISGRKWVVFDGQLNLPDGEIATAPVTETLNGYIQFVEPGVLGGQLFPDIRLEWKDGSLISATSSRNQELLTRIIQSDAGSSLIGEFAFGLNDGLQHFCKDILLDEKIGGTMHFALGRAYPECGGTNDSSIHWDIVLDTRKEGAVFMDDVKIFERGKFLF
ncbi:MAG: aminopeptidase [Brevinema sp.]